MPNNGGWLKALKVSARCNCNYFSQYTHHPLHHHLPHHYHHHHYHKLVYLFFIKSSTKTNNFQLNTFKMRLIKVRLYLLENWIWKLCVSDMKPTVFELLKKVSYVHFHFLSCCFSYWLFSFCSVFCLHQNEKKEMFLHLHFLICCWAVTFQHIANKVFLPSIPPLLDSY